VVGAPASRVAAPQLSGAIDSSSSFVTARRHLAEVRKRVDTLGRRGGRARSQRVSGLTSEPIGREKYCGVAGAKTLIDWLDAVARRTREMAAKLSAP